MRDSHDSRKVYTHKTPSSQNSTTSIEPKKIESFYSKLIPASHWAKLDFCCILARSLISAKDKIQTKERLTLENAKDKLKAVITEYQLLLFKDKINNFLSEDTKKEVQNWADEQLDDLTCLIILSNIDNTVDALQAAVEVSNFGVVKIPPKIT